MLFMPTRVQSKRPGGRVHCCDGEGACWRTRRRPCNGKRHCGCLRIRAEPWIRDAIRRARVVAPVYTIVVAQEGVDTMRRYLRPRSQGGTHV